MQELPSNVNIYDLVYARSKDNIEVDFIMEPVTKEELEYIKGCHDAWKEEERDGTHVLRLRKKEKNGIHVTRIEYVEDEEQLYISYVRHAFLRHYLKPLYNAKT